MAITHFIPTVWSEQLLHSLDKQYVGVAHCNREFEGEIKKQGDSVKVCGVTSVTVGNYTRNTNMNAPETLTDTSQTLNINQAKYFNFQIDDVDRAQAMPRLMESAMNKAAAALANTADSYVFGLASGATNVIEGVVTVQNVIDFLIDARTSLLAKGVSSSQDVFFEVSPAVGAMLLKAKISTATDNGEALDNGCIGMVGGCKVFVSGNVLSEDAPGGTYYHCMARTKDAIAFAEQLSEIDAYRPELRFADAVKGLHLYGAKIIYQDELIDLKLKVATAG